MSNEFIEIIFNPNWNKDPFLRFWLRERYSDRFTNEEKIIYNFQTMGKAFHNPACHNTLIALNKSIEPNSFDDINHITINRIIFDKKSIALVLSIETIFSEEYTRTFLLDRTLNLIYLQKANTSDENNKENVQPTTQIGFPMSNDKIKSSYFALPVNDELLADLLKEMKVTEPTTDASPVSDLTVTTGLRL